MPKLRFLLLVLVLIDSQRMGAHVGMGRRLKGLPESVVNLDLALVGLSEERPRGRFSDHLTDHLTDHLMDLSMGPSMVTFLKAEMFVNYGYF